MLEKSYVCRIIPPIILFILCSVNCPFLSNWCLSVVLGLNDLLATHGTYSFLVGTSLTIMWARLMYRRLTNPAFSESLVWSKPVFLWRQSFVFIDHSSSAFCCISGPWFPWIRCNNFPKLLLTFFTNHFHNNNKQQEMSSKT